jgi:hypothetical protein
VARDGRRRLQPRRSLQRARWIYCAPIISIATVVRARRAGRMQRPA